MSKERNIHDLMLPLMEHIQEDKIHEIRTILTNSDIDVNYVYENGRTPLIISIHHWNEIALKDLLSHPAIDPNQKIKLKATKSQGNNETAFDFALDYIHHKALAQEFLIYNQQAEEPKKLVFNENTHKAFNKFIQDMEVKSNFSLTMLPVEQANISQETFNHIYKIFKTKVDIWDQNRPEKLLTEWKDFTLRLGLQSPSLLSNLDDEIWEVDYDFLNELDCTKYMVKKVSQEYLPPAGDSNDHPMDSF